MSYPPIERAFTEFAEVGKTAVLIELKVRLLANKIEGLQQYAYAHHISETESALLPYLVDNGFISVLEKEHLEHSRKIRNKIFHCEFESAVKLIEKLRGQPLPSGTVVGANISELPGTNILEKIMNFATAVQTGQEVEGAFKVDHTTTKKAGIFGWLIEAHSKGVLEEGQKIAQESLAVLDRVFDDLAKKDMT